MKEWLLAQIEKDRDRLVQFLRDFVRCRSPNPPGDTLEAAAFVERFFADEGLQAEKIAPVADRPNFIADTRFDRPGRHLVLNGHIDVFPVESEAGWTRDPWGGELVDGKVYGRGACDMKCGTTASLFAYRYLTAFPAVRETLHGRLTLTVVSDEETFGPAGAIYLMEKHREAVLGDCCLNGEPSSPWTVRFGEKGPLWVRFRVKGRGGHGAFVHKTPNAIVIAMRVIDELLALPGKFPTNEPPELARALDEARPEIERAYGVGAAQIIRQLSVNIGRIHGGVKVNMIAAECEFEADLRVPNGVSWDEVVAEIGRIADRHHGVTWEKINGNPPNWCQPYHEMMDIIRANAEALAGITPARVVSPGGTDARLWRLSGVPAVVYGPSPHGMGSVDEYVSVDEFLHVVKSHTLAAWEYLSKPAA